MKEATREQLKNIMAGLMKKSFDLKGDLVMYKKGAEEEYLIRGMQDFELFKTKKGDVIEVTIYDRKNDDDDLFYEEYIIVAPKSKEPESEADKVRAEKLANRKAKTALAGPTKNNFAKFIKK